ncbi:hypothetical protein QBC38DRAFT_46538 [Podospora fimiseda]|uniref:Uncharacterized protein n=1 Tax=Podospora fimiseda TaxID=252190 RepID=A0AAN7BHG6_9PEZI|nr:hypothetical protein QBC38DRAFT_46538 [Podospora fimiseda]
MRWISALLILFPLLAEGSQHVIQYLTTTHFITAFLPATTITKTVIQTSTITQTWLSTKIATYTHTSTLPEGTMIITLDADLALSTSSTIPDPDFESVGVESDMIDPPTATPFEVITATRSEAITNTQSDLLIITHSKIITAIATTETITPVVSPPYVQWKGRVPNPYNGTVITVRPIGIDDLFEKLQREYPTRGFMNYTDDYDDSRDAAHGCRNDTPEFDPTVIRKHMKQLAEMGGSWIIESEGCHRLSCEDNSAIWWCSVIFSRNK